ncbi:MAG: hypothetical protein V7K45_30010, partial [Nostoc sp.]
MALATSTMLPLGTKAPDFNLPEVVSGKATSRKDSGLIFRKQGWDRQIIIGISQQCLCKKIN